MQGTSETEESRRWTLVGLVKLVNDNRMMLESLQSRLNELGSTSGALGAHLSLPERLRQLESDVRFSLETNRRLAHSLVRLHEEVITLKKEDRRCISKPWGALAQPRSERLQLSQTVCLILHLLGNDGAKTVRQISKVAGRSREHTARVMAQLAKDGLVAKTGNRTPAQYLLTEEGRDVVQSLVKDVVPRQYARRLPDVRPSSNGSRPLEHPSVNQSREVC